MRAPGDYSTVFPSSAKGSVLFYARFDISEAFIPIEGTVEGSYDDGKLILGGGKSRFPPIIDIFFGGASSVYVGFVIKIYIGGAIKDPPS
jgi:hypothetical protein